MLSLPKKYATGNDLSSICNYADISPPSGFMCEESSLAGNTPKSNFICSEAFAYRDEAIPFITVSEESSKSSFEILTINHLL